MERLKLKIAVYLFLIKGKRILLSRRFNTGWQDGNYGLPSGHLERDENLIEAVIRETKEETGLSVKSKDIQFAHVMHRKSIYIDFFFVSKKCLGEPKIMEKNKCDDLRWFPLNNLPKNMVPSVKSAVKNYQKQISLSEFNRKE